MATGQPDSSKSWTTTNNSTLPSSQGTRPPQISPFGGAGESFANPSWSTVRTLPPLRRFSEAQIPSPWPPRTSPFSPPIAVPPPLDTRSAVRSQAALVPEHSSSKRRRIERFGEAQRSDLPPEPDAESPPTLHARHGQLASFGR